ncbi:hypothetical protein [Sphingobium baderi]|uniref:hypothetical protein n=1 Tax=Sphingobium baderi TaxID=1332080 RepID=UPI002B40A9CF|nr:hypothetical protein [Sphingobium baderi]WRD75280.1 hypothetical protein QQ987_10765 [Sphingobium baderi]
MALAFIAIPLFFDTLRLQHLPAPASAGGEIVQPTGLFIELWRLGVRYAGWVWYVSPVMGYVFFFLASARRFKAVGLTPMLAWFPMIVAALMVLGQAISKGAENAYIEAGNRMVPKAAPEHLILSPGLLPLMLFIASCAIIFSLAAFSKEVEA